MTKPSTPARVRRLFLDGHGVSALAIAFAVGSTTIETQLRRAIVKTRRQTARKRT